MHFEQSLKRSVYEPWKEQYIDYQKLKKLLKDLGSEVGSVADYEEEDEWTEQDEEAFVEELVNVQLEKVHEFQAKAVQELRERTSDCETRLEPLTNALQVPIDAAGSSKPSNIAEGRKRENLRSVLSELDSITEEMNELEKFSRINYTGFLKATKKHDRKRGHAYRVRPLMQVRLAALPFNKEDYSPLLFRLSTMYGFIRQNLSEQGKAVSFSESQSGAEDYKTYKFWVHPDNLLELKTMILRRLPVLVYNPSTSKVAQGVQKDPTITSIYFDNPKFSLYNGKVDHSSSASSLRLRWYDRLRDNPEIFCEKKTVFEDDTSRDRKFTTKLKYVKRILEGEYRLEKDVQKLKDRFGENSDKAQQLESSVSEIQTFIKDNDLQPVLRANYTRTAFQIPGDGRVRITIDTNLALIREDALDLERPCRDPEDWHRKDIDDMGLEFPFEDISKGEINRFPYALLEIRVRGDKNYEWVSDLMDSHLVKSAPRFSKFVHGLAQLYEDFVNAFPFWLSEVDSDIRQDPHQAFEQEQERKARVADDEFAIGSFLKSTHLGSPSGKAVSRSPMGSPRSTLSRSHQQTPPKEKANASMTRTSNLKQSRTNTQVEDEDSREEGVQVRDSRGLRSFLPSMSKYAQSRSTRYGAVRLPPGVQEPSFWMKNEGPVKVEAKVWLANQRTFIKWQHVGILLTSLSLGLFNAAGKDNNIARALGVVYTLVAIFTSCWGLGVYMWRSHLIRERSGKDFDSIFGPVVVCLGLAGALLINFGIKYHTMIVSQERPPQLLQSDLGLTAVASNL